MRTAITIAKLHGGKDVKVVRGPEVPVHEQLTSFANDFSAIREHKEFANVELWISDEGVCRSRDFAKSTTYPPAINPFAEMKPAKAKTRNT